MRKKACVLVICVAFCVLIGLVEWRYHSDKASSGPGRVNSPPLLLGSPGLASGERNKTKKGMRVVDLLDTRLHDATIVHYLDKHKHSADALMAVGLVTGEMEYLRKAVLASPDDAKLQMLAITRNLFPEEKEFWIRQFKQTQPDNALASYLLAEHMLRSGNRIACEEQLRLAMTQEDYDDYSRKYIFAAEELRSYAGESAVEAGFKSVGSEALDRPIAHTLKKLATEFMKVENTTANAALVLDVGRQLSDEGNRGFSIDRLVGLKIEELVLEGLPDGEQSPYGGMGVSQAKAQVKNDLKEFVATVNATEKIFAEMRTDESEFYQYVERVKQFGHADALRWLLQREKSEAQR